MDRVCAPRRPPVILFSRLKDRPSGPAHRFGGGRRALVIGNRPPLTGLVYRWVGVFYKEVGPMALREGLAEEPGFDPVSRNGAADATVRRDWPTECTEWEGFPFFANV